MGMAARGHEVLEQAKAQLIQAKTVEQLRQAQAVVLPLSCGLSLEQTAALLGISVSWTCKLRTRFARGEIMEPKANREHRPRQNMNPEEEAAFLAPFIEKAKSGGMLVVVEIKRALDARLGRKTALASSCRMSMVTVCRCFSTRWRRAILMTASSWCWMVRVGIKVMSWCRLQTCACSSCRRIHRNSIPWNTCGMNSARSHSITGSSTVSMRSKIIWKLPCVKWKSTRSASIPSSHGHGLLKHL